MITSFPLILFLCLTTTEFVFHSGTATEISGIELKMFTETKLHNWNERQVPAR